MTRVDRVGLGWRGELAASILDNLEAIDVLEVIAEEWAAQPPRVQRFLRALNADRPVVLHGVTLGMASSSPVDARRLERMARLVATVEPHAWSEHLAFVRGGDVEIGHLAAPPRNEETIAGALENLRRARQVVGALPAMENIATLVDPPCSELREAEWTRAIIRDSGAPLLLDLHNLYANAVNFGQSPLALLDSMPLECVGMVHLSGGRWIRSSAGTRRLLDDHVHDVPDTVFELLEALAARAPHPLTVIIERDGRFPEFGGLLAQMQRARDALAAGRLALEIAA